MAGPWDFDTVWATNCNDYPDFEGSECVNTGGCVNLKLSSFNTGLDHLNGETVDILADGVVQPRQVVTNGQISLPDSYAVVHVGLPYNNDFKTLEIEVPLPDGVMQGVKTKPSNITFYFVDSRGGYIGPDVDNLYEAFTPELISDMSTLLDMSDTNTAVALYTGYIRAPLGASYRVGSSVFFRQEDPLPITIGDVIPEVSPGGPSG